MAITTPIQDILITDRNTGLPYFPSSTWTILEADKVTAATLPGSALPAFDWIQAFYDAEDLGTAAQLAIWSGAFDALGNPIVSLVRFAYSGERINFKGKAIFTTGTDRRGVVITSTPIGNTAATDLLEVIAYGGIA